MINQSRPELLLECSWEVCNQIGGIYTVIRSKVPAMIERWGDNYCLLGPLESPNITAEIDLISDVSTPVGRAVSRLANEGCEVVYGRWLVTGRPKVVLIKPDFGFNSLDSYRDRLHSEFGIEKDENNELLGRMILWAEVNFKFLRYLSEEMGEQQLLVNFHEWMASLPILKIRKEGIACKTVFTTHATMLGRYLAMAKPDFYHDLPSYDWEKESRHFGILPIVQIERLSAKMADGFTTVSEVTALECEHLLDKKPDEITPNGLNIKRFVAMHEVQNLHQKFKEKLHEFTMGHFFHSYSFDLDDTLYFFTSGRYEFSNKGYDITLEALRRLNQKMVKAGMSTTVVMFVVTQRNVWSINPEVLQSRGVMREIQNNVESIEKQIGERLFKAALSSDKEHRLPPLNDMVDDYWKLRFRRTIQSWKNDKWPIIVTHNLEDDGGDEILGFMRKNQMFNSPLDKVKVVYHPQFIKSTNPLFGIDYGDFVRGCNLGIFPSYYEPWGYTPLECIARGVPTVTSNLSGFGRYVNGMKDADEDHGIFVLKREARSREQEINDLTTYLWHFVKHNRRYRIIQRSKAEDFSERFDWKLLRSHYEKAYDIALAKP
jgi:glycogen(starch) synthase